MHENEHTLGMEIMNIYVDCKCALYTDHNLSDAAKLKWILHWTKIEFLKEPKFQNEKARLYMDNFYAFAEKELSFLIEGVTTYSQAEASIIFKLGELSRSEERQTVEKYFPQLASKHK